MNFTKLINIQISVHINVKTFKSLLPIFGSIGVTSIGILIYVALQLSIVV